MDANAVGQIRCNPPTKPMEAGSLTNSTRFDARRIVIGVIFVALLSAVRLRNDLLAIMLAVAYGLVVTLAPGATRPPIVRKRWLDRMGSVDSISAGMGSNQAP
jgi:hypothetical protein